MDTTELEKIAGNVARPDEAARDAARVRWAEQVALPPRSFGRIEALAQWLAGVQGVSPPRQLERARVVLFAGDHGIARHGVSAYAPAATAALVRRIAEGGGPVQALARVHQATGADPGRVRGLRSGRLRRPARGGDGGSDPARHGSDRRGAGLLARRGRGGVPAGHGDGGRRGRLRRGSADALAGRGRALHPGRRAGRRADRRGRRVGDRARQRDRRPGVDPQVRGGARRDARGAADAWSTRSNWWPRRRARTSRR